MRLRDLIMRERDERPLPEGVQEELEALDAALAGEPVPEEMEGLADLVSDLRAERPEPDETFAARLDRWAASGFDRQRKPGVGHHAAERASGRKRRRLGVQLNAPWAPAAAAACLAVLVVGSAVVLSPNGGDDDAVDTAVTETVEPVGGGDAARAPDAREAAPGTAEPATSIEGDAPGLDARPGAQPGNAAGAEERKVERDAQLELAAPADEVQDVANRAIGVVEAHDGIVLNSRVTGNETRSSALLQLQIPTRNLDAALDELSDLADVRSFSEGSTDITAPFLDAQDRVRDLRAERRSLLNQIEAATDPDELDDLKERLADVNRALARAKADFGKVRHRAQQSQVMLQITSDGAREGDWSIGEALEDAGRVLTVAAGVALIAGAVLLPLALIAALAFFVIRAARGRARERALDE